MTDRFTQAFADLYAKMESRGHLLKRSGEDVDDFALEFDNHNGPMCVICGESWCEWCVHDEDIKQCLGQRICSDAV